MRGSLVVTFDEFIPNLGGNYYTVTVNGVERYRGYFPMDNLYSTKINVGDVVQLRAFGESNLQTSFDTIRLDYTTDDENGDRGIKETIITSATGTTNSTIVTFTGSTRPDAYGFEYRVNIGVLNCLTIGSGFTFAPNQGPYDVKYKNNKIYVGGGYTNYNGISTSNFVVLDNDGDITSGFPTNLFADGFVRTLDIQNDNKILLLGGFLSYSGQTNTKLVRINTNYTVDTSFVSLFTVSASPYDLEIQSDGKILVGGSFASYGGTSIQVIIRLNTDGTLDTSFTGGTLSQGLCIDIDIQSDGKILATGDFRNSSGVRISNGIIRLNSNRSVDTSFTSPLTGVTCYRVKSLSDGKILCAGPSNQGPNLGGLYRLNSDGSIDNTFQTNTYTVQDFVITSDNKIVAIEVASPFNRIIKYNYDGSLDTSFNIVKLTTAGGTFNNTETIIEKPNGNLIIVGNFNFTTYGVFNGIIEITKDGENAMCIGDTIFQLTSQADEGLLTENEDNLIMDF